MAKRVRYTPQAESDLYEIWLTIAQDNERAADALVERIANKAALAAETPLIGVARPELGTDARILVEGRYLVIYQPEAQGLLVIAVVHGMRDPENWLL